MMASNWWTAAVVLVAILHSTAMGRQSSLTYENCGPPIHKITLQPNPPKIRHELNITVEIVAAFDMVDGTVEAFINVWPYHIKAAFCVDGRTFDTKGCIILKGEKRIFTRSVWIDDSFSEMEYYGNISLTNSRNQLMACLKGSFFIAD